jgi:pyruvate dehydrogenase E2 component (dihydrolipoamide acetyltransferase)
MATNLTMPRLSDTMEVGTIVKWHIKPGSKVKSGDVIADIETDKATMEMQTFEDGTVSELAIKEGQPTPVGTTILRWDGGTDGPGAKGAKPASAAEAKPDAAAHASANGHGHSNGTGGERIFASPLARKIAADSGIGLAGITGTGPSGRITRRDVEAVLASGGATLAVTAAAPTYATAAVAPAAAPAPKPAPAPAPLMVPVASGLKRQTIALSNMRRTIAARLVESKTTIPHYQVTVAIRVDALMALRSQLNEQLAGQGVKLSVNDFIVRACALAMHQHPFVNSRWIGTKGQEAIEIMDQVNVGVAISLPQDKGGGLVVATLRQADAKGLRQLSAETKALADKARTKGLTIDEMGDSTFTISNLGMFGVEHFTAIINPPNAAILAVGGAVKKPVVETKNGVDSIVVGHEMQMTLSSDHRIIDGAMAAEYLSTVKQYLEKPATLLV